MNCESSVEHPGTRVPSAAHAPVWLLEYEDYAKFQQDGEQFFYTLDAGRSTAALYSYRPGVLGARLIEVGLSRRE